MELVKLRSTVRIEKKIVYVDMNNVLVDFRAGIDQLSGDVKREYASRLD